MGRISMLFVGVAIVVFFNRKSLRIYIPPECTEVISNKGDSNNISCEYFQHRENQLNPSEVKSNFEDRECGGQKKTGKESNRLQEIQRKHFQGEVKQQFTVNETYKTLRRINEWQRYKKLCLGEILLPVEIQRQLKCRYYDRGNLFLKIAPFKEEEVYLDPRIVIYYDVISEQEIQAIKILAQPKFQKATFINQKSGKREFADSRITDTAWLADYESKYVEAISRRVEQITNLVVDTAEILQVAYYGIGGKYDPHYDFYQKDRSQLYENFMKLGTGNRIATVLFYLSDVEQGGNTVFPKINVSLKPRKGSAAFWYNLKPNGVGDFLTYHAACPVISGSKWAANKWIHEIGQEFRRPCTRENQQEDISNSDHSILE